MKWFTCYFHTIFSLFVGSRENGCLEIVDCLIFEYTSKCIICVYAMCLNVKIVLQISCNSAILNYRPIYNKFILIANSKAQQKFSQ